jgi:hypothetical protein
MVKIAFERESPKRQRIRKLAIDIEIVLHILRSNRSAGGKTMWDIGCVGASMLFFVIAIGYVMGCDRLGAKETHK